MLIFFVFYVIVETSCLSYQQLDLFIFLFDEFGNSAKFWMSESMCLDALNSRQSDFDSSFENNHLEPKLISLIFKFSNNKLS